MSPPQKSPPPGRRTLLSSPLPRTTAPPLPASSAPAPPTTPRGDSGVAERTGAVGVPSPEPTRSGAEPTRSGAGGNAGVAQRTGDPSPVPSRPGTSAGAGARSPGVAGVVSPSPRGSPRGRGRPSMFDKAQAAMQGASTHVATPDTGQSGAAETGQTGAPTRPHATGSALCRDVGHRKMGKWGNWSHFVHF
ncbi:hypothetical protein T484DRAFT_3347302 [Baffinella frigidus]|nr:hypothetical protein T484DRAFT_3347302 [Cryptophyta sp. CCMP2293]